MAKGNLAKGKLVIIDSWNDDENERQEAIGTITKMTPMTRSIPCYEWQVEVVMTDGETKELDIEWEDGKWCGMDENFQVV